MKNPFEPFMKQKPVAVILTTNNPNPFVTNFYRIALVLAVMLVAFHSTDCLGQSAYSKFTINGFSVFVTVSKPMNLQNLPTNPDPAFVANLERLKFNGTGTIKIQNNDIAVKYRNISVRWNNEKRMFIAFAGQVNGTETNIIAYTKEGFDIQINTKTITIVPESAKASASVLLPYDRFADRPAAKMMFNSILCNIAQDGSVFGKDFYGAGLFHLEETPYTLLLQGQNKASANIGPAFTANDETLSKIAGVVFYGIDSIQLFNYKAHIYPINLSADFSLTLQQPVKRTLEYGNGKMHGYLLSLISGDVLIEYENGILQDCNGNFQSKVALPDIYSQMAGERIDTQRLVLKTDKTGALFNGLSILHSNSNSGYKFRISDAYAIEAVNDGAWVYFPYWMHDYSSYNNLKKEDCRDIQSILYANNDDDIQWFKKRPGVTLLNSIFYLTSPQINCSDIISDLQPDNCIVKTYIDGGLTLTPYGITGKISSSGNTFVPISYPMDSSTVKRDWPVYTWEQIIKKGDDLPDVVHGKFYLQDLTVLDMKIDSMSFCSNSFENNKSRLVYHIHFPYPSFINLEFEDYSLDSNGLFHQAAGPVVSRSFVTVNEMSDEDYRDFVWNREAKDYVVIMNPQTHILWAWRLPVTFVDNGVIIRYDQLKINPDNGIFVTMNLTRRNSKNEIFGNELWIPNLFSDSSAVKKGVRILATMNKKGSFKIHDWDKKPFFGVTYTKKFDCALTTILFDSLRTPPSARNYDFKWTGSLWFPFFCLRPVNTWQFVDFNIKTLIPALMNQISVNETTRSRVCCDADNRENWNERCRPVLSIKVNKLDFNWQTSSFNSIDLTAKIDNESKPIRKLELSSFTNAFLILQDAPVQDILISINQTNDCGITRMIKEELKNALRSDRSIVDLICHDRIALTERNLVTTSSSCCNLYYYGNYQITSTRDGQESILLSADHAKYYPSRAVNKFEFSDCTMQIRSDDEIDEVNHIVTIPGMQLSEVDEGYYGAFGATYSPVAMDLPYEGACRFYINPHCGYFYLLMEGTFTYFLTFRGLLLLFHAPFEKITANPFPYATTDPITDMRMRSICPDNDEFLDLMQLTPSNGVYNSSLLTGFITTGNASYSFDYKVFNFELAAGAGMYFYQNKVNDSTKYQAGLISNTKGEAEVFVKRVKIKVSAYTSNSLSAKIPSSVHYHDFERSLSEIDVATGANITIEGCAGIAIGHCNAAFSGGISLSKQDGFQIDAVHGDASCDIGDCP